MRRHLNTLYVTTEESWLHKDGENVVVKFEGRERGRVPIHIVGSIVCFGAVGATPALLGICAARGVCVVFLDRNGRFLARVEGPTRGNVLLRRRQYRAADDERLSASLAGSMIVGKLVNQRTVVRRALRDHDARLSDESKRRLRRTERRLTRAARNAQCCRSVDALRGIEGDGARDYNGIFNDLLTVDDPAFAFKGRTRRPPLDAINALLSFFYTLATHDCRSALEAVGLDPAVGFLHRDRPGRPSLALDLVEEIRPVLADRVALTLINRRQLTSRDFSTSASQAVALKEGARKEVLVAYQNRKKDVITHPFLGEKTTLGLVPFLQAQILARHLRDDLEGYPPFIWR